MIKFDEHSIQMGWFNHQLEKLGGGFKYFLCSPLPGEMIQFDDHIFQMGWFNHQLEKLEKGF